MSEIQDALSEKLLNCIKDSELFNLIVESLYEGAIYVDEKGIIRFVNNSYAKYNNTTKEEMIGHKYEDFEIDPSVNRIQQTRAYEPFNYYFSHNRGFIASRRPVYRDGQFAGVYARYFSLSPKDVNKFGSEYSDLISRIQIRDIMVSLERAVMELNTYKDHFNMESTTTKGIDSIIGNSAAINNLKNNVLKVADSPSSVLITGESGTGKELVAEAIHFHGNRSSRRFVKVNCAAIPESLLESELFGYSDGAFTGARKGGKMGKFELANGGTIFLDEIGDMPLAMQAKLLRVLQEREFERLGGESVVSVDIRVVSATNKDLVSLIKQGNFREDLYYRLNIISLHTEPLRQRKNDIPPLIEYFINKLSKKLNRSIAEVSPEAMNLLVSYDWPGNVRELINALESAINFSRTSIIEPEDLPFLLRDSINSSWDQVHPPQQLKTGRGEEADGNQGYPRQPKTDRREEADGNQGYQSRQSKIDSEEERLLISVLDQCNGDLKATAEILDVSRSTLYRMMKKYNLQLTKKYNLG
ncbi:MAG: sigma 54-interacting transcriptional regulator [Firmicutes bacterium]|nr:sigma 54-interacting transcriptional regulator [Bacillota bacterium]